MKYSSARNAGPPSRLSVCEMTSTSAPEAHGTATSISVEETRALTTAANSHGVRSQ